MFGVRNDDATEAGGQVSNWLMVFEIHLKEWF
jgi:hypothetical protein